MSASLSLAAALLAAAASAAAPPAKTDPQTARGRVTGVGGVFFKSRDPKALAAWYKDVLGLPIEAWGGAMIRYDQPEHPPMLVFMPFPDKTTHFEPSTREFMLNLAVDDLDAMVARLTAKGVPILKREDDANGRFAWIVDPEGVKIELWEPKR